MLRIKVKSKSFIKYKDNLPKTLTFENTIESKKSYNEIINKIKYKLNSQYSKQTIKYAVDNTFDLEFTKDNLFSYLLYIAQETKDDYNSLYDTDLELPLNINDDIYQLVNLTFNGGNIDYYDQVTGQTQQRKYDGMRNTQTRILKPIESLNNQQVKSLVDGDMGRLSESLFLPFFKVSFEKMALADNRNIIGCIAFKDSRTRDRHYRNSKIAIDVGSLRRDGTNPFYYQEPNCRCKQLYFKSIKEAQNAGFEYQK
jgi:hypothetical protein